MRVVSYVCECGSTGGEVTGTFACRCLMCGKPIRAFSQKLGKSRRKFDYCGVDATMVENERWSWAMAVNPEDIPKAMKAYPGSEYAPDTGQLRIKSRHHKLQEMKRRKLVECDGFRNRTRVGRKVR